jgi:hypothetical protein
METKDSLLTDMQQFRLDVLKALAGIQIEINAIQEALKEGEVVTAKRLKQIRLDSSRLEDKFLKQYGRRIGLL